MYSLPDAANATLYNLDCTYLADARYKRESPDTITLMFPERPPESFPERFFLMPEGETYDFRAFIFSLSGEFHPCEPSLSEDGTRYLIRAVTNDIPEQRKNFRVYVTLQSQILFKGQKELIPVTVKDIGTGGFQFVSKQRFEPDSEITAIFTSIRTPISITARIQKLRPVRKDGFFGYGCQFVDLPPGVETLVRNFVFQTEALQAKAKRERESSTP